jgi:hypothetical protein
MGSKGSKKRRRRILLLVLIGLGVAAAKAAQQRGSAPAPLTVVPTPPPVVPTPKDDVITPGPVDQGETEAAPVEPEPVETVAPPEAPVAPDGLHEVVVTEFIGADGDAAHAHLGDVPPAPADSLTSFFEEILTESKAAEAPKRRSRAKGDTEPTA